MRIIFAGTPAFSVSVLDALAAAGHELALVVCQPDRPAGRGQKLLAPAVKTRAQALGLEIAQPASLRDEAALALLRAVGADLMLVVAYGLILPQAVLDIPRLGCINVHASLLPRWRGAAPIQRAIEAGDRQTGVTIMQMDAGLDSGPMLRSRALPIGPDETGGRLHDRLAALGAQLAVETLEDLSRGLLRPEPQPCAGITYAAKISRADAHLDWNESAQRLADRIRAFDPSPGCVSALASRPHEPIKIWAARAQPIAAGGADPGVPVRTDSGALEVACGQGRLALLELQRAGARRQTAAEFLRGRPIAAGDRFIHTGP